MSLYLVKFSQILICYNKMYCKRIITSKFRKISNLQSVFHIYLLIIILCDTQILFSTPRLSTGVIVPNIHRFFFFFFFSISINEESFERPCTRGYHGVICNKLLSIGYVRPIISIFFVINTLIKIRSS